MLRSGDAQAGSDHSPAESVSDEDMVGCSGEDADSVMSDDADGDEVEYLGSVAVPASVDDVSGRAFSQQLHSVGSAAAAPQLPTGSAAAAAVPSAALSGGVAVAGSVPAVEPSVGAAVPSAPASVQCPPEAVTGRRALREELTSAVACELCGVATHVRTNAIVATRRQLLAFSYTLPLPDAVAGLLSALPTCRKAVDPFRRRCVCKAKLCEIFGVDGADVFCVTPSRLAAYAATPSLPAHTHCRRNARRLLTLVLNTWCAFALCCLCCRPV
jgi:hypothetical protein